MDSFVFNDAIRFKLATQQGDTGAKVQVFFGVFAGVVDPDAFADRDLVIGESAVFFEPDVFTEEVFGVQSFVDIERDAEFAGSGS